MKILLFGATGRVGQQVLLQALNDCHEVTAFVRSIHRIPMEIKNKKNLYIVEGDVLYSDDINKAMSASIDIVFSALSTDKNATLSKAIPEIIHQMDRYRLKRIVCIGTAGILNARSDPSIYRYQSSESRRKSTVAAEDHLAAYQSLEKSSLDWTIFCPTYLPSGEAIHPVRYELDRLPDNTRQITVGNTALFAYREMMNPAFFLHRVGIAE